MDRLICRMLHPGVMEENTIVSCFLKMQYHMNTVIVNHSSRLARRHVYYSECTGEWYALAVENVKVKKLGYASSSIPPDHKFTTRYLSCNLLLINP